MEETLTNEAVFLFVEFKTKPPPGEKMVFNKATPFFDKFSNFIIPSCHIKTVPPSIQ